MTIRHTPRYTTDDGRIFDDWGQALNHDLFCEFAKWYESDPIRVNPLEIIDATVAWDWLKRRQAALNADN